MRQSMIVNMWREVRQPYVFIIAMAAFGTSAYLLLHHDLSVEKAAFLVAMGISALLVSKATIAMKSDAPNVSLLMGMAGLLLFLLALNFTKADTFKDMVVEGLALQMVGQIAVWLDTAIERSNRLRGIVLPSED